MLENVEKVNFNLWAEAIRTGLDIYFSASGIPIEPHLLPIAGGIMKRFFRLRLWGRLSIPKRHE